MRRNDKANTWKSKELARRQIHTYKRNGKAEREYVIPELNRTPVKSKAVEWFKTRGISKQTLDEVGVGEGKEYMPQTGKTENTIQFNYFVGGQLTNVKYRDGRKNFGIIVCLIRLQR